MLDIQKVFEKSTTLQKIYTRKIYYSSYKISKLGIKVVFQPETSEKEHQSFGLVNVHILVNPFNKQPLASSELEMQHLCL